MDLLRYKALCDFWVDFPPTFMLGAMLTSFGKGGKKARPRVDSASPKSSRPAVGTTVSSRDGGDFMDQALSGQISGVKVRTVPKDYYENLSRQRRMDTDRMLAGHKARSEAARRG